MKTTIEKNLLECLYAESVEFARLHRETLEHGAQAVDNKPRVIVCGLLKAGKSSLLNALSGQIEPEHFATKASRATTKVAELTSDGVTYVDTPGLDATVEDDEEAWRGLASADQLVFVHSLRIATLDVKEVEFLQQLLQRRPDCQQHMVVALSHAESADDDREERLTHLRASLTSLLGFCPALIPTSCSRHRRGVLENKPALLALSGIAALQYSLSLVRASGDWRAARVARDRRKRRQLSQLLNLAIVQRQILLQGLQDIRAQQFSHLRDDFGNIVRHLRERLEQIEMA